MFIIKIYYLYNKINILKDVAEYYRFVKLFINLVVSKDIIQTSIRAKVSKVDFCPFVIFLYY